MTDQEMIEYLHDSGKMPDRYYYTLVNKPLEAYKAQREKLYAKASRRKEEAEAEKALAAEVEEKVYQAAENALNDLLKDFGK